jgi:hypothetical protein
MPPSSRAISRLNFRVLEVVKLLQQPPRLVGIPRIGNDPRVSAKEAGQPGEQPVFACAHRLVPRGALPPHLRFRVRLLLHPGALGAGFVASVAMQPALMHGWLVVLGRVIGERERHRQIRSPNV